MKESVTRTLFFISILLSGATVTENPVDVDPYSAVLNFFPALSAVLANMRSHGSSLRRVLSNIPCSFWRGSRRGSPRFGALHTALLTKFKVFLFTC
jgi:hypothetical protein